MNYTEECCMGYAKHETHDLVTGMLSLIIVSLKLSSQELLSWNKKWEYSRLSTLRMVWGGMRFNSARRRLTDYALEIQKYTAVA